VGGNKAKNTTLESVEYELKGGDGLAADVVTCCTSLKTIRAAVAPHCLEQGLAQIHGLCGARGFRFAKLRGPMTSFTIYFHDDRAVVTTRESEEGSSQVHVVEGRASAPLPCVYWVGDGSQPCPYRRRYLGTTVYRSDP
jgi:hypothetical protein